MSSDGGEEAAAALPVPPFQSVSRGAAWLGLVNVLSKGSQVLVTLALARFLRSSQLGEVTIMVTVLNLGQLLQSMGVYDVVARTSRPPQEFAGTVASLSLAVSSVLALLCFTFARDIAATLHSPGAGPLVRAGALGLPFIAYGGVQLALVHRRLDFRRRLLPDAGSSILGALVTVTLAALGFGTTAVVAGVLLSCVAMPTLGFLAKIVVPLRWHSADAREAVHWVRIVGPGAVIGLVLLNVDYVIVSRDLGSSATGTYSLAYRFAFAPYIMVAVVLAGVAFPNYSRFVRERDWAGLEKTFLGIVSLLLAVVGFIYITIALLADRVIILSPRWVQSGPVLSILCGYGLSLSLQLTFQTALRALGRPGMYLASQVIHCSLLVPSLLVLVPRYGILGAAWAQLCSAALSMLITMTILHTVSTLRWQRTLRELSRVLLAVVVTGAVGLGLRQLSWLQAPDSLGRSAVLAMGISGVYVVSLAAFDRKRVMQLASSVTARVGR